MTTKVGLWFLVVLLTTGVARNTQAAVLQVTGTVGDASIAGTIDTSGWGVNQLDVHVPPDQLSPVWYAYHVTRPLIWYGAEREPGRYNYWDLCLRDQEYYIYMYPPFEAPLLVLVSGSELTYTIEGGNFSSPPDVVGLQSYNAIWYYYPLERAEFGCCGTTRFLLASGETLEEATIELLHLNADPSPFEGHGAITSASIVEIAPDVWRFTWLADVGLTPEPSTLPVILCGVLSSRRCR